jgi:hypothetical protein
MLPGVKAATLVTMPVTRGDPYACAVRVQPGCAPDSSLSKKRVPHTTPAAPCCFAFRTCAGPLTPPATRIGVSVEYSREFQQETRSQGWCQGGVLRRRAPERSVRPRHPPLLFAPRGECRPGAQRRYARHGVVRRGEARRSARPRHLLARRGAALAAAAVGAVARLLAAPAGAAPEDGVELVDGDRFEAGRRCSLSGLHGGTSSNRHAAIELESSRSDTHAGGPFGVAGRLPRAA